MREVKTGAAMDIESDGSERWEDFFGKFLLPDGNFAGRRPGTGAGRVESRPSDREIGRTKII